MNQLESNKFVNADLAADMTNQTMGLLRGVSQIADPEGADFSDADLNQADLEFTSLRGADHMRANLTFAHPGGASSPPP